MWENLEEQRKRREARRLARFLSQQKSWTLSLALSGLGLVASVGIGAWWTAGAVGEGAALWTLVRFSLTVAVGTYYMVWFANSRGAIRLRQLAETVRSESGGQVRPQ